MAEQLYAYTVKYWRGTAAGIRDATVIVGAGDVDGARREAQRLDADFLGTVTTPRKGRPVAACRVCHRWEPILLGLFTRVAFASGVELVCDDCHEKRDEDYATWQGIEVEVI